MVLLESKMVELASPAHDFSLMGIDDKIHHLHDYDDKKVLAIIFMCNHCPYVQKVWPDLVKLVSQTSQDVQFIGINANSNQDYPEDSFEKMKEYAVNMGHNFPYLYDENQETARIYEAVCTPDIFVYDPDRKLAYRGAFEGLGAAINDLLNGRQVNPEQKFSIGCSIKWNQ